MVNTISRTQLQVKMERGDRFHLIETLPKPEYERAHLPGAINLPPDRVSELAPIILPDRSADIIVYCAKLA
jgi:rhodanese-related sulfurtransferase